MMTFEKKQLHKAIKPENFDETLESKISGEKGVDFLRPPVLPVLHGRKGADYYYELDNITDLMIHFSDSIKQDSFHQDMLIKLVGNKTLTAQDFIFSDMTNK